MGFGRFVGAKKGGAKWLQSFVIIEVVLNFIEPNDERTGNGNIVKFNWCDWSFIRCWTNIHY